MKEALVMTAVCILFALPFLGIGAGIAYFKASQEAVTFNKFSEQDATTWDALWADLRVEACRTN